MSVGPATRVQSTLPALRVPEHANQREQVIWVHCPRISQDLDRAIHKLSINDIPEAAEYAVGCKNFIETQLMSKPQAKVAVTLASEWSIRRPFVFRYLDRSFVDEFFYNGTLRLSSFSAFSKHKDEERLDTGEGIGILENVDYEGEGQTLFAVMGQGHAAYVLCGSTIHSETLAEAFQANSGFRINDPTAFGVSLAQSIPGFRGGREGACIYADGKIVNRQAGRIDLESMRVRPDGEELDMGKLFGSLFGMAGDDLYFLKNEKYQHQAEYRLLWGVNRLHGDFIEIHCPDAVQFCTRFEDL